MAEWPSQGRMWSAAVTGLCGHTPSQEGFLSAKTGQACVGRAASKLEVDPKSDSESRPTGRTRPHLPCRLGNVLLMLKIMTKERPRLPSDTMTLYS